MKAYDLRFGESADALSVRPGKAVELDLPDARVAGWCGGRAPGIEPAAWPRSPVTGLPAGLGDQYSRGRNAWDDSAPEITVWLGERADDPNTGIAPAAGGEGGYAEAWSSDDKDSTRSGRPSRAARTWAER